MTVYSDYSKARVGYFFGLTAWQLGTIALASMPIFGAIQRQAWMSAMGFILLWLIVAFLVCWPVRGRSATGWLWALARFTAGGVSGRTRFRARAAVGQSGALATPDLPGVLARVEIHDGPPLGPEQTRVAVIQDHFTKCWAVSARVVHPGIGLATAHERNRFGHGLTELIDLCSRGELVDELQFMVRTVPDDGAERGRWMAEHAHDSAPPVAQHVNTELHHLLTSASVRTEAFVTIVVPESRIGRDAKEAGGGVDGRARVLYTLMSEVEAQLHGAVGMSEVGWLTSPELAAICRTGFAPTDRVSIVEALAAQGVDPSVNSGVPWALAGPSGADQLIRHYSHDAWNTIASTVVLPDRGAMMGALAPLLAPTEVGERRSLVTCLPIASRTSADRQSASSEWAADMADSLRDKAKVKQRARARDQVAKVRSLDDKLARGNALVQPYAVCAVTVPKTQPVAEAGRRLDASIRRAGFAPLRLDIAQDMGFVSANIPLGVSLRSSR